jgi:hypothetical protein
VIIKGKELEIMRELNNDSIIINSGFSGLDAGISIGELLERGISFLDIINNIQLENWFLLDDLLDSGNCQIADESLLDALRSNGNLKSLLWPILSHSARQDFNEGN